MKKLFSFLASSRKPNTRVESRRLRLETLEERQMLDATGNMVADAQDAEVPAAFSGVAIPVTIAEDVVDHSDDFNTDGSPYRISLREAFEYLASDEYDYDTISLESADTVHVLNSPIYFGSPNESEKAYIRGNQHTITTNGRCDAIKLVVETARFENLIFSNCGTTQSQGGAIRYEGSDVLTLDGCRFDNCVAESGGAIYNESTIAIDNTEFNNCRALYGGAIYASASRTSVAMELSNSVFTGNNAISGGAIFFDGAGSTVEDCTFTQNGTAEGAQYGGAIYVGIRATPKIDGCTFTENGVSVEYHEERDGETVVVKGDFAVRGGAIYNAGYSCVSATKFVGNYGYYGGAIYDRGSILLQSGDEFERNEAYLGGAVYVRAQAELTAEGGGHKFIGNVARFSDSATQTHGSGGAIYVSYNGGSSEGKATIENAEFAENQAYKYGGAIVNYGETTTSNCRFENNVAAIGGAVCNADRYISGGDVFMDNGAYYGDQGSSEERDRFYTAGGHGGAIYSANNATYEISAYLGVVESVAFTNNRASRSGGALSVVSGAVGFTYREEQTMVFSHNVSMYGMGGAIVLANGLDNVEFFDETPDQQRRGFVFNDNYAWYAPTVGVTAKLGDEMRRVVEAFGFNYSKLTSEQVDTFTRYDDQLTDGKLTYEYLADLYKLFSPKGAITLCYIGEGSTGEVTIHPGEEVKLSQLGIPTTVDGVVPGGYKIEFYYGDPNSDPDRDPESKTAFELIVGVTGAPDYMTMRRVEIVEHDDPVAVPMTGFSFATYDRPVESVSIDWGDGSQVWFTKVGSFSTNAYHMFPEKIEWDPKSGTPDPNVYAVTADFALVGQTRHIKVTFQYNAHASAKDWHVRPGETGTYDPTDALLDSAFAELELFDI